jgi:DNA-binding response OmpR family regulator
MAERRVFVVEDDPAIRRGLCDALRFGGFSVAEADRGDGALEAILARPPDLVLLDVLLPGLDGFEVLDRLRSSHPRLPVILLTAKGATDDRVRGLELGADDYVVKPFDIRELLARVEAVLRRSAERPTDLRSLDLGGLIVSFETREAVAPDGSARTLSETESSILRYLAVHRGRVIERSELLQRLWGGAAAEMETRTVDMHISRLREKLEPDPARPRWILTVRSRGYRLAPEAAP